MSSFNCRCFRLKIKDYNRDKGAMITDVQKIIVEYLNEMYHSQSLDYRAKYRKNYFALLNYIISLSEVKRK